jgi:leucyl aminopeptidase
MEKNPSPQRRRCPYEVGRMRYNSKILPNKTLMQIKITSKSQNPQAIIIPLFDNENLSKNLEKIAKSANISIESLKNDFKAGLKETQTIYSTRKGIDKIYLLGLGKNPDQSDYIKAFRSFFFNQKKKLPNQVAIDLTISQLAPQVEFIVNGICLGNYDLDLYKTDKKSEPNFFQKADSSVEIIVSEKAIQKATEAAQIGEEIAKTQIRILDLVNEPANKKYPAKVAEFALESGKKYGFDVKIFDEKQCAEMGLNALLAVGKGSTENPARFIVMETSPPTPLLEGEGRKTVGLVGKGVTFDTGGISIKGSNGMSYMKSDMAGAGAVLGTMELVAKLKLPIHVVGVIPCTENCVDGNALKPSDVIHSYSGKTIEVIDTDAEGRLILADGLSYIKKNYNPDVIIDLATLTGNCIAALGYVAAALLSNNDELAGKLLKTSQLTGEKLWRMPLWDDYKDAMKSDIADIKNLSSAPVAGAITAAKFLELFIDGHKNWAHLDIAGMAFGDSEFGSMKSATAYGVRLLTAWLRGL